MMSALRAELRKLLSVRSTYVIILFCLVLTVFFAFYVTGFKSPRGLTRPDVLAAVLTGAAQFLAAFIALAGVLLMTHEYRYGTITYTSTLARRRSYVLLAKITVITVFSILVTVGVAWLAPLLTQLAAHLRHVTLPPQAFPLANLLARAALYGWGYSMLALIFATVLRGQVGTIAVLFLYPSIGESLLGLVLKGNAKYLPFNTLADVLQGQPLSYPHDIAILFGYVAAGWVIAWILFMRRDAA